MKCKFCAFLSSMGNSGLLSPGESQVRQSRSTQPTVLAGCFSVSIILRTLTWTTGSSACSQMLMRAVVHGGEWTLKRVCTESWLWEKNPFSHRGIESASAACRFDALPTELHLRPISVLCKHRMSHDSESETLTWYLWFGDFSFASVTSTVDWTLDKKALI